jgi:hypothetical protein
VASEYKAIQRILAALRKTQAKLLITHEYHSRYLRERRVSFKSEGDVISGRLRLLGTLPSSQQQREFAIGCCSSTVRV